MWDEICKMYKNINNTVRSGINWVKDQYNTFINSAAFQGFALNAILFYGKSSAIIYKGAKHVYANNKWISVQVDKAHSLYGNIRNMLSNTKFEPSEDQWISICTMVYIKKGETVKAEMIESYLTIKNPDKMIDEYIDAYDSIFSTTNVSGNLQETIIIMKDNNKYIVRIGGLNRMDEVSKSALANILSSENIAHLSKFLSVKYTHPKMTTPIYLNIPWQMYISENHILSPSFVLRMLQYQKEPYMFDTEYVLNIMDDNIDQFNLTSKHIVVLHDKKYEIINETMKQ